MLLIIGISLLVFAVLIFLALVTVYLYILMVEDSRWYGMFLLFMIGLDIIAIHFCMLGYMRFIYPYFLGR